MFKKFAIILFLYALCLLLPVFFLRPAHAVTDTTNLVSGVDYVPLPDPVTCYTVNHSSWGNLGSVCGALNNDLARAAIARYDEFVSQFPTSSHKQCYKDTSLYYMSGFFVYFNLTMGSSSDGISCSTWWATNPNNNRLNFHTPTQKQECPADFPTPDVDQDGNNICLSSSFGYCKQFEGVSIQKWIVPEVSKDFDQKFHEANYQKRSACLGNCSTVVSKTSADGPLTVSALYTYTGTGESCSISDDVGITDIADSSGCTETDCNSAPSKPDAGDTCYIDENGVYYCYTPSPDDELPFNCSYDSSGAVVCENFDGSSPANCIDFEGKRTCYDTDGTDIPTGQLPNNCATFNGKTVCATSETSTGQTIDKDGDGKPDTKLDGTKTGTTTTGTITTTTTTTTDPTTGTTTTSTTGTVTIDTGGINNTLTDGFSDVVDAINGLENGGGDCTENCVTDPTAGLSGGEGIYDQTDKTIESVYADFSNRIKNAPIASVATDFFNYNPSAGACPTWTFAGVSGGMFNFPSFTFDFYCTFQHWGVIHTVIIIVFSMFAFRVAFLD